MTNLYVTQGDITTVPVDALVLFVNPEGIWNGAIDRAVKRVAGPSYHNQLITYLHGHGLNDGQTILARGSQEEHDGLFDNIIFVVDNLLSPLSVLVVNALVAANRFSIHTVAFPLARTGIVLGEVEPDINTVVKQMLLGIKQFLDAYHVDMSIYIVVYDNPEALALLSNTMSLLKRY